jgi:hypothetical protein
MILDGTNGAFLPTWTTATRPASPSNGLIGYNSTTSQLDQYVGGAWASVPTASGASLTTPSFTSTIGVGGATASASGAGVTFPATESASSNANTLDDYEEGTWTPNVGTLVNLTGTPTYTSAKYQKIGNRCFFSACINGLSVTTSNTRTDFNIYYPFTAVGAFAIFGTAYSNNSSPVGCLTVANTAYSQVVFIQGITPPNGSQTFQVSGSIYTA